jgi:tagatose-6-phosphate ketose/aldose isomerase
MVIFGPCLAHIDHLGSYEEVLSRVDEAGRSLLPRAADCASTIAKAGYTQDCFVGSGPLRAVARERALKLLELTAGKTMTTSESTLGLRHGPMAALDHDSLFICFLPGDQRVQHYGRNLLQEISKKRLARCRVVVTGDAFPGEDGLRSALFTPRAVQRNGAMRNT